MTNTGTGWRRHIRVTNQYNPPPTIAPTVPQLLVFAEVVIAHCRRGVIYETPGLEPNAPPYVLSSIATNIRPSGVN
ncbi:hypothetical protein [Burkholderia diffusa]|uniref:hypothetical protein n=1 Tax=Burkholderia diffusa TaxID=488732 RepID=UPI000A46C846|nr:hypothetical protein [Burkholderia diffusa]